MEGRESSSDASAAKEAFRKHYADLISALQDPEVLACELFSEGVVSETIIDEVGHVALTGIQKKMKLLSAVRDQLAVAPDKMKTVLEAFRKLPSLREIARKVDATYCMLTGTSPHEEQNPVEQPTSPITQSTSSNCPLPLRQKTDPTLTRATTSQDVDLGSPMDTYAAYLKSVYTQHKMFVYDKWPNVKSKRYINLAVIEKEEVSKEEADEFTRATIHGNIDDIERKKKAIELRHIGRLPDGSRPKCILVEGAPGVGKSTFSLKLCRKWGKGKILQQYKLVVLLRLRERRVREAKSVSDLFRYSDLEVQQIVARQILRSQGKEVLLLFEGYDELPAKLRTEDSIFLQIIKGELLPEATVLITSRPVASEYLLTECKHRISQRIEILGFTRENIQSYLESTTGDDPSLLSGLQQYLSCYPHIRSMVYIPLNCAIVVEVYKMNRKDDVTIPKTMTELYSSLIRSLLLRYLREHYKEQRWRIRSFSDLPPDVHKQLCELGRIAYKGIANDQQVIFSDLPESFETLDLMQCVPELYVDEGAVLSYNFLHLTIQEYLAAFYLSQQPVSTQVKYFRIYKGVDSSIEEEESESSSEFSELSIYEPLVPCPRQGFGMVCRFLAGLTKFKDYPCSTMASVLQKADLNDGGRIYVTLETLHWIFEAQDSDIFEASISSPVYFNDDVTNFDCFVLGYCITHWKCNWKIFLPDYNGTLEMFLQGALEGDKSCTTGVISELKLGSDVTSIGLKHLMKMPEEVISSLEILDMSYSELDLETSEALAQLLFSLPQLESFYFNISSESCNSVAPVIKASLGLKYMYLRDLRLFSTIEGVEAYQAFGELLSSSTSLKVLNITNSIGPAGACALAAALRVNTTLQELNLGINRIGSDDACALAEALPKNTSLQILNLGLNRIGPDGGCALARALHVNTSLHTLNLSQNSIGPDGGCALAKALRVNTSLQKLYLSSNSIGTDSACAVADALSMNTSLQTLDLIGNSIGPDGACALAKALHVNTSLQKLYLSYRFRSSFAFALTLPLLSLLAEQGPDPSWNIIGDRGASAFADALIQNKSLRKLELEDKSISLEGIQKLLDALNKNSTLEELVLTYEHHKYAESVAAKPVCSRISLHQKPQVTTHFWNS